MRTATLLLMCLSIALVAGCQGLSVWTMSAPNADVGVRIGSPNALGDVEVGIEVDWYAAQLMEDEQTPDAMGAYFAWWPTVEAQLQDTPAASPIREFLEDLNAKPYAGMKTMVLTQGAGRRPRPAWFVGTEVSLVPQQKTRAVRPKERLSFVTEYIDGDGVVTAEGEDAVFIGLRWCR